MPKCEIFDRSDFDDFYTIKPLCKGDFGVKNFFNFFFKYLGFIYGCKVPYTYAQSIFKEVFFKFGPKLFFSVELLRPLVSVNNNF